MMNILYICHEDLLFFIIANSANPDEMPHYAAFHLELHCLPRYLLVDLTRVSRMKMASCQHAVQYLNYCIPRIFFASLFD